MAIYARIIQENTVCLWGLSSRERLDRMLNKAGISTKQEGTSPFAEGDTVLLLRGDFLYDQRIIVNMIEIDNVVLDFNSPQGRKPVAAHVSAEQADQIEAIISEGLSDDLPADLRRETPGSLVPVYLKKLRKIDPPYLYPITENNRRRLEKRLFSGSYKGVTDLITKWVWPVPAQWVTGICSRNGIVPNHVTSLSLVLSIMALLQFYYGAYAWGLFSAWLMTFLDTVDGKLARVTINYSPFGNIFDHGIDLIFPPIWYIAWGLSLQAGSPEIMGISVSLLIWLTVAGYIIGRMCEGFFKQLLEPSGIFCWQVIDSCFRLITGRRNPNLVLLTISLFFGRPEIGLLVVCLWTVLSSLFLIYRLVKGFRTRSQSGELRSWFLDVDPVNDKLTLTQRWFCQRPDLDAGGDN
ncbi:MAG: CDP-alcohol phosphatidyltransferase family protein [Desulfuromusa sp.]|nr:CDP-alcohol phosphatidyltransferase family protein [Desulfuromusa sp.]